MFAYAKNTGLYDANIIQCIRVSLLLASTKYFAIDFNRISLYVPMMYASIVKPSLSV